MRLLLSAAAAAALVLPLAMAPMGSVAFAQTTTPQATPAPMPAPVTPAAPAPAMPQGMTMPATPRTAHKHQTLQERFDAANTTHDGHLTEPQAAAAKWKYLDTHFSAIDKDHKGYVTVDDIHAYAHATRAARHMKPATKPVTPAATTN